MASLDGRVDLRVVLVSSTSSTSRLQGTDLGISLPPGSGDRGHVQLDYDVGSYNDFALLVRSLCLQASVPLQQSLRGSSSSSPIKLCDPVNSVWLENSVSEFSIQGKLRPHLREFSKKIVIHVTDEDARLFSYSDFQANRDAFFSDLQFVHFGFLNFSNFKPWGPKLASQCDPSRPSSCPNATEYIQAALATGGKVFDMNEGEWSQNFKDLANATIEIAENRFRLPSSNLKVLRVEIDGVALDDQSFSVEGDMLIVSENVIDSKSVELIVSASIL